MMGFAVTVGHSVQKPESEAVIKGNLLLPHADMFHEPPTILFYYFFLVRDDSKRKSIIIIVSKQRTQFGMREVDD